MKLLVLAQTPPPVHGQSLMVKTLVQGLPAHGMAVHHVNLNLSRDSADIGRWRVGKVIGTFAAVFRTLVARFREGCDTLYYVPAPAKRGALYRDWLILLLCRPFFSHVVLHWHAIGLGTWLRTRATTPERVLTQWLLGNATVAIVLAPELAEDARVLSPRQLIVVPNCVPDPGAPPQVAACASGDRTEIFFLGQCSRAKGLFATIDAVVLVHRTAPNAFRLTIAGGFADEQEECQFRARLETLPEGLVRYVGAVSVDYKIALFRSTHLFCFPTQYPHEGQPLVLIEALAHDIPIVTTRWRAIPGMLPTSSVWIVEPGDVPQLANALMSARTTPAPNGTLRAHYLARYTPDRHLARLAEVLRTLDS